MTEHIDVCMGSPLSIEPDIGPIDSYINVCLCDVSAADVIAFAGGVPLNLCEKHENAAKLISLMRQNLGCTVSFAKEGGGFQTLDEVMREQ